MLQLGWKINSLRYRIKCSMKIPISEFQISFGSIFGCRKWKIRIISPEMFWTYWCLQNSRKRENLSSLVIMGFPSDFLILISQAGVSRSASVVIAYIMKTENCSFQSAFAEVKIARPAIKPNAGFTEQLKKFGQWISFTFHFVWLLSNKTILFQKRFLVP